MRWTEMGARQLYVQHNLGAPLNAGGTVIACVPT